MYIKLCGEAYLDTGDPQLYLRGLINIPNVGSHEVAQGRCYMPILGWAAAFHYFRDFTTSPYITQMQEPHLKDPVRPANPDMQPYAKAFTNASPMSRYVGNEMGVGYKRSTTAGDNSGDGTIPGGNGTSAIYPYVSDKIDV